MSRLQIDCDILIIGSGFASSLLARGLAQQGCDVVMVERARHPRFALGESTTPLGNLALERLARRFDWHDIWNLANWGRLRAHHPGLRCGLKRGFTFFGVDTGEVTSAGNRTPCMVAASPEDALADTQWYRPDFDHYLARTAVRAGVRLLEQTVINAIEIPAEASRPVRAAATSSTLGEIDLEASFVVDGSGPNGVLSRALDLTRVTDVPFRSSLLFAHFEGLEWHSESGNEVGVPYAAEHSAVHHLLDCGWMYELRFHQDTGMRPGSASCGWVLDHRRCEALGIGLDAAEPEAVRALFGRLLGRHPSLGARFERAVPSTPLRFQRSMQWRLREACGPRFALLPHAFAFYDPMFSVGIAWSLLAVERLCDLLGSEAHTHARLPSAAGLERYQRLLSTEADHIELMLAGAYNVLDDVEQLSWFSQVYFAAASFAETQQRVLAPEEWQVDDDTNGSVAWPDAWSWRGFLGAEDEFTREMIGEACALTREPDRRVRRRLLEDRIPRLIAARNLAGLADARCHPMYGVDVNKVVEASSLLGLSKAEARDRLPRLTHSHWRSHQSDFATADGVS